MNIHQQGTYIVTQKGNDLTLFNTQKNETKSTLTHIYIELFISKPPTTSAWEKEIENTNATNIPTLQIYQQLQAWGTDNAIRYNVMEGCSRQTFIGAHFHIWSLQPKISHHPCSEC